MKKLLFSLIILISSTYLIADTTYVAGTIVNQTWTQSGSPYCVTDDIFIASLIVEPAVKILFIGNYECNIGGILTAIGTKQDSIYFTNVDTISGWQGIFFDQSNPGSELAYCVFEGSINSGIRIVDSDPIIRNCLITNNIGIRGGGIDIVNVSSFSLDECKITSNSISGFDINGGGIFIGNGNVYLDNCTIEGNSIYVSGHNSIGRGGGVYVNGNLNLTNCIVSNNVVHSYISANYWNTYSYSKGGGIFATEDLIVRNSKIHDNNVLSEAYAPGPGGGHANSQGGGIYSTGAILDIKNSIISCDTLFGYSDGSILKEGGGIYTESESISIINSTIAYNSNSGIYNEVDSIVVEIMNCIFWENDTNQIIGNAFITYSDIQNGYPGIGNIDYNPLFYSLPDSLKIVDGSLCIDSGNPDPFYNDPEDPNNLGYALWPALGTIKNDMGAHGGDGAIITSTNPSSQIITDKFILLQNYPNPFKQQTNISFSIPEPRQVKLVVYSITGQEVVTLINEFLPVGEHSAIWSCYKCSPGVYFYDLQVENNHFCKKMIVQ